jgi:CheY-like chemotaxis protein
MNKPTSTIRGLINDLTRTLTGSMVHMDNLLLNLRNDSGEFDEAWLANHQLERAVQFFIELRSEYMMWQESINQEKAKSYRFTGIDQLLHDFNNLLAVVVGQCDLINDDYVDVRQICQITGQLFKSILQSHYLINKTICLPERNVSINNKYSNYRKNKITKTVLHKKANANNSILLVEDDESVREILIKGLTKHKYIVIGCPTGEIALAAFDQYKAIIVICIIDVGLPGIKGPELVNKLLLQKLDIKILFISGYDENQLNEHYALIGQYPILIKPFRLTELLKEIRSIISC